MHVLTPRTKEDWKRFFDLRWRMLRKPWNQPRGTEKDGKEAESVHVMISKRERIPIGVGSSHFVSPHEAQIRWMAVDEKHQKKGVGVMILQELERQMKERGATSFVTDARVSAAPFYEKHGYHLVRKGHVLFSTIKHYRMRKDST